MDWTHALDTALPLLERARSEDVAIRIPLAYLRPGMVGVVECRVTQIQPTETFTYRSGGEGTRRRVTVTQDGTDVAIVLWGDEVHMDWVPGTHLTIHGPTIQPAYRGDGMEMTLGAAVVHARNPSRPTRLADW